MYRSSACAATRIMQTWGHFWMTCWMTSTFASLTDARGRQTFQTWLSLTFPVLWKFFNQSHYCITFRTFCNIKPLKTSLCFNSTMWWNCKIRNFSCYNRQTISAQQLAISDQHTLAAGRRNTEWWSEEVHFPTALGNILQRPLFENSVTKIEMLCDWKFTDFPNTMQQMVHIYRFS